MPGCTLEVYKLRSHEFSIRPNEIGINILIGREANTDR